MVVRDCEVTVVHVIVDVTRANLATTQLLPQSTRGFVSLSVGVEALKTSHRRYVQLGTVEVPANHANGVSTRAVVPCLLARNEQPPTVDVVADTRPEETQRVAVEKVLPLSVTAPRRSYMLTNIG